MAVPSGRHSQRVATIRKHKTDTVAYLFANQPNCLGITDEIVRRVTGRNLVHVEADSLPGPSLPRSWALAVVLCPGDDTAAIAEWARAVPQAEVKERVWFYEAQGVNDKTAYQAWRTAGLSSEIIRVTFRGWKEFNRLFGQALNDRIWQDFRPR